MFLVLLALGAILWVVLSSGSDTPPTTAPAQGLPAHQSVVSAGIDLAKNYAVSSALSSAGLKLSELPAEGCSSSVMEPTKVLELIDTLEEPFRTAVATLLDSSSSVWTVQVYQSEAGMGLCLPVQSKLLVFPANQSSQQDFGKLLGQLQGALVKQ